MRNLLGFSSCLPSRPSARRRLTRLCGPALYASTSVMDRNGAVRLSNAWRASCIVALASLFLPLLSRLRIFDSISLIPVVGVIGILITTGLGCVVTRRRRTFSRCARFAADFPPFLLATAAGLKVGLTAHLALGRAGRLLPEDAPVRVAVQTLLTQLSNGSDREEAIAQFGDSFTLPELELFRSALALVTEHGGAFSPTLQRLASVVRDRDTLTKQARVSTALMRLTANSLIVITPALLTLVTLRTNNYWSLIFDNPVTRTVWISGAVAVLSGYLLLHRLSNFHP